MKISRIIIFLISISILGTLAVYPSLPTIIPSHWGLDGQVDGTSGKSFALFTGTLPLLMYILFVFLPKIDPKKESYEKHKKAYDATIFSVVLFIIGIHWMTILAALNIFVDVTLFIRIFMGILFIVIGNFMLQIRQNYFFGIKTPWTLSSEVVWKKTHRFGAYCFAITGVLMLLSVFTRPAIAFGIVIGSVIATAIFTIVYSYYVFVQESKKE